MIIFTDGSYVIENGVDFDAIIKEVNYWLEKPNPKVVQTITKLEEGKL